MVQSWSHVFESKFEHLVENQVAFIIYREVDVELEILPNEDAKEALTNGVSAKRFMSSIMANRVGLGAVAGASEELELSIWEVVDEHSTEAEAAAGGDVYLKWINIRGLLTRLTKLPGSTL